MDFKGVFFSCVGGASISLCPNKGFFFANCEPSEKLMKEAELIRHACASFKRNTVSEAKTTSKKTCLIRVHQN